MADAVAANPCCISGLELVDRDYVPSADTVTVCIECGRAWRLVDAERWQFHGAWKFDGQQRRCTKCGHWSCPCCHTWCDELVGDDYDPCCDGECSYAPDTHLLPLFG